MDPHRLAIPASLETERLTLRRYNAMDAAAYAAVLSANPEHLRGEVPAHLLDDPVPARAQEAIRNLEGAWMLRQRFTYAMVETATGAVVGEISLLGADWDVGAMELGYWVTAEVQGRGFATEAGRALVRMAFVDLGLRRLGARIQAENVRSQAVVTRCGFTPEGRLRDRARTPDGRLVDQLVYGMTRADFEREYGATR